jgi:hypothetical protein
MKRRNFLISTSIAGLTATYNNISFSINYNNDPKFLENENSVIYLYLSGGPTHIETFNPLPLAPSDRKSITGNIHTKIPGFAIGGMWDKIANQTNKLTIVNSFHHSDPNHESATHWMLTGERTTPNSPPKWPSFGSVISGQYGPNIKNGLPSYIKLNNIQYDGAAWMGTKYMGYSASKEGVDDLFMKNEKKFNERMKMLEVIESNSKLKDDRSAKGWTELRNQAVNVLVGKASEAFLIEKDKEFASYKNSQLSKDMLTAIRLVEAGVKFVTINYGGWDMHQDILGGLKSRVPELDHTLSLYFNSAEKRDINYRNLLVMSGDFGRTPKINKDAGRDHWPHLVPLLLSCDAYEMNRVIGTSDNNGERPVDHPFEPEDLKWTIFEHMGIKKDADWYSIENRPMMFVQEKAKNILRYTS